MALFAGPCSSIYLVEFCGPTQNARSSRSHRSADRGLLRVPFARTSTRQKRAKLIVSPGTTDETGTRHGVNRMRDQLTLVLRIREKITKSALQYNAQYNDTPLNLEWPPFVDTLTP